MTKMNLKAQSAIEYLFTYGWMLIAVSVIGGAIYSVASPECIDNTSGFAGQSVAIEDFGVDTDDNLDVVLRNNENQEVNVSRIILEDDDGERQIYDPTTISSSSTEVLSANQTQEDGTECRTYDATIRYDLGPLENQQATGSLTSDIDFPDMDAPSEPSNFNIELS